MIRETSSIAVVLATHNRAEVLRETLEHICRVDRTGIDVHFYLIDNNSSDHTGEVIDSFLDRLPITHLHEPRQGMSIAMNTGVDALRSEDIILFTDDDVTPCFGWFREVLGACERWPGHDVFGGRILLKWPDGATKPDWAVYPEIRNFGFAENDLGVTEIVYPPGSFPFGPNFWTRRSVFEDGRRFDATVGPTGKSYRMGSEIVFLRQLTKEGHEFVYCPAAFVQHRINPNLLSAWRMCKRAWARGKGKVYMAGLPHRDVLERNRPKWYLLRAMSLGRACLRVGKAMLTLNPAARFRRIISAITLAGIQVEAMQFVREQEKDGKL